MSGDGTNDRGAKPPRTLFSLGRPGPRSAAADPVGNGTVVADVEVDAAGEVPIEASVDDAAVELACGACGSTLITGAAFCGECGTPVAQLDEDPFELVEEVPMADLEHADFGEYIEELPIDDEPAVLYADADAVVVAPVVTPAVDGDPAPDEPDEAGATAVLAQPAAVLYADPTQAEPLPPSPTGTFEISQPTFGTAESEIDGSSGDAAPEAASVAADVATPELVDATTTDAAPDVAVEADAAPSADDAVATTDEAPAADDDTTTAVPLVVAGAGVAAAGAVFGADAAGATADPVVSEAPAGGDAPGDASLADAADAPAAESSSSPWAESPTVEQTAVPIAGAAAAAAAAASGPVVPPTPVAAGAYGQAPPTEPPKSKTGLLVGIAAAVVLVLIVGGIVIVGGGSKDEGVQTAQQPVTTVGPSTSTTALASSTTVAPTTSATPTTAAPTTAPTPETTTATTAAPITTPVPTVPTTPRPPVTAPPTTLAPARVEADPPSGGEVNVKSGQTTTIRLTNTGGVAAGCALTGSAGISVSQECSPNIPPGASVTVTVTVSPTWEGPARVTGVLEGSGGYSLLVTVPDR